METRLKRGVVLVAGDGDQIKFFFRDDPSGPQIIKGYKAKGSEAFCVSKLIRDASQEKFGKGIGVDPASAFESLSMGENMISYFARLPEGHQVDCNVGSWRNWGDFSGFSSEDRAILNHMTRFVDPTNESKEEVQLQASDRRNHVVHCMKSEYDVYIGRPNPKNSQTSAERMSMGKSFRHWNRWRPTRSH
eukprot:TRINITY_DN3991_c0_g1_i2.p2 TRINITY_DN3991_c0_g1~~TRINITY_DN3991_c0_g1_i2.p2  ORF type:complete len:206 (-),score=44.18 TRINITY_DN3991_c0_g1_i2:168-737(-)